VERLDLSLSGQ
jgi:hypothetical protein